MKYLVPASRLHALQEDEFDLLVAVSIKRTSLQKETWGAGWIFEATESFNLFCMLKFGWAPIEIEDTEYEQVVRDGVTFFSKERGKRITKSFYAMTGEKLPAYFL